MPDASPKHYTDEELKETFKTYYPLARPARSDECDCACHGKEWPPAWRGAWTCHDCGEMHMAFMGDKARLADPINRLLATIDADRRKLAVAEKALREITVAPCNCYAKLKDGSHYHDCQSTSWPVELAHDALKEITTPPQE